MQFRLVLACLATQASAATWTLKGFSKHDGSDTNCDNGFLSIDEPIDQSGSAPQSCSATSGTLSIQSINWNSGGSSDAKDSFFVCFYTDFNCPSSSAIATFPEGDFGCQVTPNLRAKSGFGQQLFFAVKASSDKGC